MNSLLKFFSSLKLTVVLLTLSLALIFFGTLDQVEYGIWETQKRYFESFFVIWSYPDQAAGSSFLNWIKIPMPGGYLLGGFLLLNLFAAHTTRFKLTWKKSGIFAIHLGLILLLISELLTDIMSKESQMSVNEGQRKNYSETALENELVLINRSNPNFDTVHSISEKRLESGKVIDIPDSNLSFRTIKYFPNARIARSTKTTTLKDNLANRGVVEKIPIQVIERPIDYAIDAINTATAYIEIFKRSSNNQETDDSLGIWLVSNVIDERFPNQIVVSGAEKFELAMRFKRTYYPFDVELVDFTHEKYPGTDIPYNFSSAVILHDSRMNTKQQALIYMNHPLRYAGLTFYQASFANEDTTSIIQVVKNPGWLLPYISVLLMGLGMIFQFGMHFFKFSKKKKV